jgi:hypothetical protein
LGENFTAIESLIPMIETEEQRKELDDIQTNLNEAIKRLNARAGKIAILKNGLTQPTRKDNTHETNTTY